MITTKEIRIFFRIRREYTDGTSRDEEVELQNVKMRVFGKCHEHPDFDAFAVTEKIEVEGIIVRKK